MDPAELEPPAPAPPAEDYDLERRLEKRLMGVADRLWEKLLSMGEQFQDFQAELWRLSTETERVGGALASVQDGAPGEGELEARMKEMQTWIQDLLTADAGGHAAKLERVEALVQGLLEDEAGLRQQLQEVRDTSQEATDGLQSRLAMAEDRLLQTGGKLAVSDVRLADLEVKVTGGLGTADCKLADLEASVRGLRADVQTKLDAMQTEVGQQRDASVDMREELERRVAATKSRLEGLCGQLCDELQGLGAAGEDCRKRLGAAEQELARLGGACLDLPQRLAACDQKLAGLDEELRWMRSADPSVPEDGGHAHRLPFRRRYEDCERRVAELGQALLKESLDQFESQERLQLVQGTVQGLSARMNQHERASKEAELKLGQQQSVTGELKAEADRQQRDCASLSKELAEQRRGSDEGLRSASERWQAALVEAEQRLAKAIAESAEELGAVRAHALRRDQAFSQELQQLAELSERLGTQQRAGQQAAEQGLEQLRPRLGGCEQLAAACERRLQATEAWQGACGQWQAAQEQRLASHAKSLQWLAEQGEEVPRQLEARLAEVRAVIKEDLAASVLNSFQGEVKLWATLAQMDGRGGPLPGPFPDDLIRRVQGLALAGGHP